MFYRNIYWQLAGTGSTNYSKSRKLKVNTAILQPEDFEKAKNYYAQKMPNPENNHIN